MFKSKEEYFFSKKLFDENLNKGFKAVSLYLDKKLNRKVIFESKVYKTIIGFKLFTKLLILLALFLVPLMIIIYAINVSKQNQYKNVQAKLTPSVSLSPSSLNVPPEASLALNINSGGNSLGFIHLELTFNPQNLQLTKELSLSGLFTRIVKVSSMSEANSQGRIIVILGLDPANVKNVPTGSFLLATITFGSKTTAKNVQETIAFDQGVTQIVKLDQTAYNGNIVTATGASLTINPVQPTNTPVPTNNPVPTNTPVPTTQPIPTTTSAPTARPSPIPKPTRTPNPTHVPNPNKK